MNTRRTAGVLLAGLLPVALMSVATGSAYAHGAPTDPISRAAACGMAGRVQESAACRAAVAANGGRRFDDWDNLRVANVRGQDREVIPDGQLCSAGIRAYRGLDIARADWPATRLRAGSVFTLTYRTTIPHRGTFRLYLTRNGRDPLAPLRWADLTAEPFAKVTDPELVDGAYRINAQLPEGLTGRHVLYTVWQNSSTPDTYYSCSDVVITGDTPEPGNSPSAAPEPGNASTAAPEPTDESGTGAQAAKEPSPETGSPSAAPQTAAQSTARPAADPVSDKAALPNLVAAVAAVGLAMVALCASAILRRRSRL